MRRGRRLKMVSQKMLDDIRWADPVERKAMSVVMGLSKTPLVEIEWKDDTHSMERKKRDFVLVFDGGLRRRVEVKGERESAHTGNITVEYECWGNPSGLAATGSDLWIEMIPVGSDWRAYFADVRRLREWMMFQVVPGGVWKPNRMVVGSRYERLVPNSKAMKGNPNENPTMSMLLNLKRHVVGVGPWMDGWAHGRGSVDWRIFGAV